MVKFTGRRNRNQIFKPTGENQLLDSERFRDPAAGFLSGITDASLPKKNASLAANRKDCPFVPTDSAQRKRQIALPDFSLLCRTIPESGKAVNREGFL